MDSVDGLYYRQQRQTAVLAKQAIITISGSVHLAGINSKPVRIGEQVRCRWGQFSSSSVW
jgi:hypothetical protein